MSGLIDISPSLRVGMGVFPGDAVFAVKQSLIRQFEPRTPDNPETPAGVNEPWCLVENDLVLEAL